MSDWTENFRNPFQKQVQAQQKAIEDGNTEFKEAQNAAKPWPEMKANLEDNVFPKLDDWISVLKDKLKRLKLIEFDIKKRIGRNVQRLEYMKGVTIWHPYAWFVRFKICLLVAGIVMIFLVKVAIIVAEVLLFVYFISKGL
ncbi:MAG: hypothetical protein GY749_38525 [Desulfobacteraceae bacterium]|nr:hypothetical protein [Desulfobacteraceae bacterium]